MFINKPSIGFEDVESDEDASQILSLAEGDLKDGKRIPLKFVRFQSVNSLHVRVTLVAVINALTMDYGFRSSSRQIKMARRKQGSIHWIYSAYPCSCVFVSPWLASLYLLTVHNLRRVTKDLSELRKAPEGH